MAGDGEQRAGHPLATVRRHHPQIDDVPATLRRFDVIAWVMRQIANGLPRRLSNQQRQRRVGDKGIMPRPMRFGTNLIQPGQIARHRIPDVQIWLQF